MAQSKLTDKQVRELHKQIGCDQYEHWKPEVQRGCLRYILILPSGQRQDRELEQRRIYEVSRHAPPSPEEAPTPTTSEPVDDVALMFEAPPESLHQFVPSQPETKEDWAACWCGSRHMFF